MLNNNETQERSNPDLYMEFCNEILELYCEDPYCFDLVNEAYGSSTTEDIEEFVKLFHKYDDEGLNLTEIYDKLEESEFSDITDIINDINGGCYSWCPIEDYFNNIILENISARDLYEDYWGKDIAEIVDDYISYDDCIVDEYVLMLY